MIRTRLRSCVFLYAATTTFHLPAQGAQVLWSNPWSNAATVASHVWTNPPADVEAADDFDLHATITRVVVDANGCSSCAPPGVVGATVRFYQWNQGSVGALQHQVFVPAGTAALGYVAANPETFDITLPNPFVASGRHFLSVQVHFVGGGYWSVWVGNWGNPTLSSVQVRDRLGNNQWTTPTVYPWPSPQVIGDLTFQLWGVPTGSGGQPAIACTTWSAQDVDGPAGNTHSLLRDVKVFATDDAWAVGHSLVPSGPNNDSLTMVQRWNGSSWTQVPSPSPGPAPGLVNCQLTAVDGTSSSDLWAAGTQNAVVTGGWVGQQVFAMHWDGQGWSVPAGLPMPNTSIGAGISGSRILDVKALAPNDVWFVGDWLDLLSTSNPLTIRPGLLLHWNGSGFDQTILPVVTGVGHQYLNAVAAASTNDVWVVGGAGVAGNLPGSAVPVLFHWDGSNWQHRPCPAPAGILNLYDVEVLAPNSVLVFGTATVSTPAPATTRFMAHWNGSGWTLLPGPPAGVAHKAFAANDVWSVGSSVHHWDGAAWTLSHEFGATTGASLGGVDAIAPCQLFGVGGQPRVGQVAPFAARQDHDQLWRTRTRLALLPDRAPGSLQARSAVRPGDLLAVAIDDPGHALSGTTAATFWVMALFPAPGSTLMPFGGRNGGPGEVLLDLASIGHLAGPVVLHPGQGPAVHTVPLPANAALVGIDLRTQGLLVDTAPPAHALFTNALDLHIGW